MLNFQDIPQFPRSYYRVDVELRYLQEHLDHWAERTTSDLPEVLIMNPTWQRGHVWTPEQQTSYVEYMLKGGTTGKQVYFNCSSWNGNYDTPIYCVDGLQRITALTEFMKNKVPVFGGHYLNDIEGNIRLLNVTLSFNMLKIKNTKELLKVYLDFNSGGTPHNPNELKRIQEMIDKTPESDTL